MTVFIFNTNYYIFISFDGCPTAYNPLGTNEESLYTSTISMLVVTVTSKNN